MQMCLEGPNWEVMIMKINIPVCVCYVHAIYTFFNKLICFACESKPFGISKSSYFRVYRPYLSPNTQQTGPKPSIKLFTLTLFYRLFNFSFVSITRLWYLLWVIKILLIAPNRLKITENSQLGVVKINKRLRTV